MLTVHKRKKTVSSFSKAGLVCAVWGYIDTWKTSTDSSGYFELPVASVTLQNC